MKTPPRLIAVVGIGVAILAAMPPAFSMNVMERIVTTQTGLIRHEASEYQRKVAEAHARAYMTTQLHSYRHSHTADESAPKTGKTAKEATPKPKKHEVVEKESQGPATADEKKAIKKKLPRYVAVETPTDKHSAPGTKKDVMIWDTQNESLVGNNVYDMTTSPAMGAMTKFDTFSAQYVGNGL
jgi:predicted metal-dependent hydrolase